LLALTARWTFASISVAVEPSAMLTLDECVSEIVRIATEEEDAVERSISVADAYLASIRDPSGTARWRTELIEKLRQNGPMMSVMDDIIAAIEKGRAG
jgi:hypothetical protein